MVNMSKASSPRQWLKWRASGAVSSGNPSHDAKMARIARLKLSGQNYVVDSAEPVDYAKSETPSSYTCSKCGATGIKLWRDYQTMVCYLSLYCLDCACKKEGKVRTPTEDGKSLYTGKIYCWYRTADSPDGLWHGYDPTNGVPVGAIETMLDWERTDQIGWLVPAVPTKENDTFWGYSSVPENGCNWWDNLPYQVAKAA